MSHRVTAFLATGLILALGAPARADRSIQIPPTVASTIEAAVNEHLFSPEKTIFLPVSFGIVSMDDSDMVWVCGRFRTTDEAGTYLTVQSEFVGRYRKSTDTFALDVLAVDDYANTQRVGKICSALIESLKAKP